MASWWESLSKKWFPFLGYVVYKKRPVAVENTLEIQPRNGKDPPKIDDCLIENPLKIPIKTLFMVDLSWIIHLEMNFDHSELHQQEMNHDESISTL